MNAETIISLCRECSGTVYGARAPSPRYSEAVARLLLGTAATESLLRYRRQIGFRMDRLNGAWGLWQTEYGAVSDSVIYLRRRGDVLANAARFVNMAGVFDMSGHSIMRRIHDDDRFAVVIARLHYFRVAEAVPDTLEGQAAYWKKYYNTRLGAGTVAGYVRNWNSLIQPEIEK